MHLLLVSATLVWSGIDANHPGMWALEVIPVVIGMGLLVGTGRGFPLTPVLYRTLTLFALIHLVGAHYSYSEVPVGEWLRHWLDLERNPFDRFGHLMQGVTSALVIRELLLRTSPLTPGRWSDLLSAASALAVAAAYELLEWLAWVLILLRFTQANVLGAQGDPWDTQWDMALGLAGACLTLLLLRAQHDRELGV